MKASIDITLIFLFFMIDGIGAIVVFVSNQVKAIEFYT